QSYYVLGYYTTNTTWDGQVRSIKVRLKPKGKTVRARRQYRAPTEAEINAIVAGPPPSAGPPTAIEVALRAIDRAAKPADEPQPSLVDRPRAFHARGRSAPE